MEFNSGFKGLKTAVYDWYNHFKSGQELLKDKPCSGRPSISVNAEIISKVKELVHADWQITINEAVNELGISYGSAQARLTEELQMIRGEMRWILHHNNTPSHMAMAVQQILAEKQVALILQPLYSPDLTPCDFWLSLG